jgi:voltage-gated potassium channel Kch
MKIVLDIINIIFTVELVARVLSFLTIRLNPLRQVYTWIDFLSLVPFFMDMAFTGAAVPKPFGAFNALRVVRLIKLGRYYTGFDIFSKAVGESLEALLVPVSFLLIFGLFCSVLLFHLEHGMENGCQHGYGADHFVDIPQTIWFIMVTMTTVGYGDLVPCTIGGRFVTTVAMLGGLIFMAIPIAVIGTNFTQTWANKESTLLLIQFKEHIRVTKRLRYDHCVGLFRFITNDRKYMTYTHLRSLVKRVGMDITAKKTHRLFEVFDEDQSGKVPIVRILQTLYRNEAQREGRSI